MQNCAAPTYSSWLNQVENCFAKIERHVFARGIFTSVKDLARKFMHYLRVHTRSARPIKWSTAIGDTGLLSINVLRAANPKAPNCRW